VIEVAHEALLRRWPTLRRWHDQERAALEIQQEVTRAASAWKPNECGFDSAWLTTAARASKRPRRWRAAKAASCTVEQVLKMKEAGLAQEQIEAACGAVSGKSQ
jgi:hypothetical protein